MNGPYMEPHEMRQLEELLEHSLNDTVNCWEATRLRGGSASLCSDGNVCIKLLHVFDKIRATDGKLAKKKNYSKEDALEMYEKSNQFVKSTRVVKS